MVHTPHLDSAYEHELTNITASVSRMSSHAERMVRDAVLAMLSRDGVLAKQVIADDQTLDAYETDIDQLCVRLLARRAPVGADLRMVTATLKLVTDIERIGDLAVNIVKRAGSAGAASGGGSDSVLAVPDEVSALAKAAVEEVALTFRALRERDGALARSLRDQDHTTDACNRAAFDRLIRIGREKPESFEPILALTNICRHLERIGDHAVNIAEMVVYMVDGKVVRHRQD